MLIVLQLQIFLVRSQISGPGQFRAQECPIRDEILATVEPGVPLIYTQKMHVSSEDRGEIGRDPLVGILKLVTTWTLEYSH